ncbi:hypothetical protein FRC10_008003 [Ceratobasidium sp. 414]|nr:hypothetical protein FRC10_008003 [Ceratobasidium sp. 414]
MKRKEHPTGSVKKAIRPVLYYPNAADDEPSQVIMPSSPPLAPHPSPERAASRHSRRPGESSTALGKRRSAVDNIGYKPENIPTPRASLLFSSTQSSPARYSARTQPSSIRNYGASPKVLSTIQRPRLASPTKDVHAIADEPTDPETGPDGSSDYVVDTDEDRPVATTPVHQPHQPKAPSTSPFKPPSPFEPPTHPSPTPQQSPTKRVGTPQPTPAEIIELLSSSESESGLAQRPTSGSPSLGAGSSRRRDPSTPSNSSDIVVVDPPSAERAQSDEDEVEITMSNLKRSSTARRSRRIVNSPVDEYGPFQRPSGSSRTPWRHVPSELRKRPLAPEFGDSSTPRPSLVPHLSEDVFFRAPQAGSSRSTRSRPNLSPHPKPSHPTSLEPSSPQVSTPTPAPRHASPLVPATPPPPVRVLRMDCVLLPRPSRATLNALARFEKLRQARVAAAKGKGRVSLVVEVPTPAAKSKSKGRGRKSGGDIAGGLGKGLGKGGYAAREEGRWESSSPVRGGNSLDVNMEVGENNEVDEMDLVQNEDEEVVVDDGEVELPPADVEPDIPLVALKTPSPPKRGRKPGKKKQPEPESSPTPPSPARSDMPTPLTKIKMDPLVDLASTYRSLPREIKITLDKYCHCCRGQKKGKLKMRCTNHVSRARRNKKTDDGGMNVCGSVWCQRCVLKYVILLLYFRLLVLSFCWRGRHNVEFDPLAKFTCPMCDDSCVCDKCRRKKGLGPLGRFPVTQSARKSSGGGAEEETEDQEPEDDPEPADSSSPEPPEDTGPASPPHAPSENDSGAKRVGYAELMRQRGPTKWHGRHTPPPLRHRRHASASANDVYIPRGPVENAEDEFEGETDTESRGISPSVLDSSLHTSRADTPMEAHAGPLIVQDALRSFDADYSVDADAAFMGAGPTPFHMDTDMNSLSHEYEPGGLAMDMEDLLLVDELTSIEPESRAEYDDTMAMNAAILGLGPATLVDDAAVLAGLDANLEAARQFYDPRASADLGHNSRSLYEGAVDSEQMRRQQLRLRIAPDVMLAGSDSNQHLGGFGDTQLYGEGSGQEYLGAPESSLLSLDPATLSRSPSSDPYLEHHNTSARPALMSAPTASEPEPEPESEVVPELTIAGSAKSTDLETPSPQFGVDAGLDNSHLDLQDLFGGQDVVRVGNLDPTGLLLGAPDAAPIEIPKPVVNQTSAGETGTTSHPEATPTNPALAPTDDQTTLSNETPSNSDDPPTPLTFVLPTPDNQTQLRASLKRRFQTQTATNGQVEQQGRVTRSRSRRTL